MKQDRRLPDIPFPRFRDRLRELSGTDLPDTVCAALHEHYAELRRWNPRLSLIGPGTVDAIPLGGPRGGDTVLSRHYGESLAALPLIRASDRRLVDLGSGAGFPGMALAAALPRLEVTLVEPRQRKWAFLRAAARRSGLSCRCLNARVERPLPRGSPRRGANETLPFDEVDVVTCRALALAPEIFEVLHEKSPRVRFLLWRGSSPPELPAGFAVTRELPLAGSASRRILEISSV